MTQLHFNDMGLSGGEPIEMHVLFDSMSTIVRLITQDLILRLIAAFFLKRRVHFSLRCQVL